MSDLIQFLRARLNEDEYIARRILAFSRESYHRAPPERWVADRRVNNAEPPYFDYRVVRTERPGTREVDLLRLEMDLGSHLSEHVARFGSPARVLAEVDAKRRIIDLIALDAVGQPLYRDSGAEVWQDALRLLALPYVDHADFRAEWRPAAGSPEAAKRCRWCRRPIQIFETMNGYRVTPEDRGPWCPATNGALHHPDDIPASWLDTDEPIGPG